MQPSARTYDGLKPKFHPYCIGHPACKEPVAQKAWAAFQAWNADPSNKLAPFPAYITDIGDFLLETSRTRRPLPPTDTLLYSVRKAAKLRYYLTTYGLHSSIAVPKKFILKMQNQLIVMTEKIPLLPQPKKNLHPIQAAHLTKLIFLVFIDPLDANNHLSFTPDGKVAIMDTTPIDRCIKKSLTSKLLGQLLFNDSLRLSRKFCITAQLKTQCSYMEKIAVEEVEKKEWQNGIKQSIASLALCCFSFCAIPIFSAHTALSPYVIIPINIGLMGVASLKVLVCFKQCLSVHQTYTWSLEGESGLKQIESFKQNNPLISKERQ